MTTTNEPCPDCGMPATCEHELRDGRDGAPVHVWDCRQCGTYSVRLGWNCPHCMTAAATARD